MAPKTRRAWTSDELHVLTAIFLVGSFSLGDDARDECRVIADAFGRSPASIDRQWRNIAALLKGETEMHIGNLVRQTLQVHLDNPVASRRLALSISVRNHWNLERLIEVGALSASISEVQGSLLATRLRAVLVELSGNIEYCIFPSGTHGYQLAERARIDPDAEFAVQLSCLLSGNETGESVIHAKESAIRRQINRRLESVTVQQLPSGRHGVYDQSRFKIENERFLLSIRVFELKEGHKI